MKHFIFAALVGSLVSVPVFAGSSKDTMAAAVRLKQAVVGRSFEQCMKGASEKFSQAASEKRCKQLLQALHKQELKVIGRLRPALTDPAVNVDLLNKQMVACYSGGNTYSDLIQCWVRLADRLDSARRGEFLLKR